MFVVEINSLTLYSNWWHVISGPCTQFTISDQGLIQKIMIGGVKQAELDYRGAWMHSAQSRALFQGSLGACPHENFNNYVLLRLNLVANFAKYIQ